MRVRLGLGLIWFRVAVTALLSWTRRQQTRKVRLSLVSRSLLDYYRASGPGGALVAGVPYVLALRLVSPWIRRARGL